MDLITINIVNVGSPHNRWNMFKTRRYGQDESIVTGFESVYIVDPYSLWPFHSR